MLILRDIKVLHLEPTDVCQAACPLCARETDTNFKKDRQHHLSMNQILKEFDEEKIKHLDKMFMCGNYGDPAAGKHTLNIYQEFRKLNTDIVLGMNTNGGLQTTLWWHKLGRILNQINDYVVFSIDGLESTNSTYRVNVNWTKLMANAEAFIAAGGSAHWDMLVYRHNQHQADECEQLVRDMGFSWFRAKVSRRSFTETLQQPTGWQPVMVTSGSINCHALNEQSEYMDAQGRIAPCCWLGGTQDKFTDSFDDIQWSWSSSTPNAVCKKTCTTSNNQSSFSSQWQREVNLAI
jgi:sulfatase maturation enzyme AslB (radical SAM superfamily)